MAFKLTKREWLILRMWGSGMKLADVAEALGCTAETLRGGKGSLAAAKGRVGALVQTDVTKLIEQGKLEWEWN